MRNPLTRCLPALVLALAAPLAIAQSAAPSLTIQDLGRGAVALDGPWQFHLGDDPTFAAPDLDDATGHNGWEPITAYAPWGAQGHRSYVGYAWYRKHLSITPAAGVAQDWSLYIPHIDDVYALYWNGQLILTHGKFPPHPSWAWREDPQALPVGSLGDGVLAVRVYKLPLSSYDTGLQGGFYAPPLLGSHTAIEREQAADNYNWLRGRQFMFAIAFLEALIMVLALIVWWRDRSQYLLLFTAVFCCGRILLFALGNVHLQLDFNFVQAVDEPFQAIQDIGLMYLLLWVLDLRRNPALVRWTNIFAIANAVLQLADGSTAILLDWSNPRFTLLGQWSDGILTVLYTLTQFWPLVLVLFAVRHRLDLPRWLVAGFAFFAQLSFLIPITLAQGSRFTHWTVGRSMGTAIFTILGARFAISTIADLGLLIAIIYAVFAYSRQALARKQTIEQELRSAQELLQVLIPEALPSLPGYAVTSSYRPAQEVGGDFFQIIPASGNSWVIALGDVSGKGLRAAMAVSLIVGAIRTLAESNPSPASILAGLNRRLHNRLQGGFATCLVLQLDAQGRCTLANAGHPSPFLNGSEISLAGSLPLGLEPATYYEESQLQLQIEDFLVLYTDGLLEARNAQGEIFSFQRLASLVADRPSAAEALQAAQAFGQEDDITVLTLTRLAAGEKSTTQLIAPALASA